MRARIVVSSIVVAVFVMALAGVWMAQAKAHVPLGRAQICTAEGEVRNVTGRVLSSRINKGGCRLTSCAFNDTDDNDNVTKQYIFLAGEECDATDSNGDGFCDVTGAPSEIPLRLRANDVTPACTSNF